MRLSLKVTNYLKGTETEIAHPLITPQIPASEGWAGLEPGSGNTRAAETPSLEPSPIASQDVYWEG